MASVAPRQQPRAGHASTLVVSAPASAKHASALPSDRRPPSPPFSDSDADTDDRSRPSLDSTTMTAATSPPAPTPAPSSSTATATAPPPPPTLALTLDTLPLPSPALVLASTSDSPATPILNSPAAEFPPASSSSSSASAAAAAIISPPYWRHHPDSFASPTASASDQAHSRWGGSRHNHRTRHQRSPSTDSFPAGGITLRDNESAGFFGGAGASSYSAAGAHTGPGPGSAAAAAEADALARRGAACWARSVAVTDYVVVGGSGGGSSSASSSPLIGSGPISPGGGGGGGTMSVGAFVVWNVSVETLSGSRMRLRKRYSEFDALRGRLLRTFPGFEAAVPELPPKSFISRFRPGFLERRRAGLQYFLHCVMLNPEFSGSPVLKDFLFS